ncbi:TIGR02679 domain-containing protein, partial [Patulibacter sp. NPDC049589]|uniref:TIGR02679 domain-containing protein n=1 Tax=Patulibacter sp. NPDC049589 TaxID=3154731 RepID=UPI003447B4C6
MSTDDAASDPGLGRLLRMAAPRLEKAGLRPAGRLKLPQITEDEIRTISGLLGSRWRAPQPGADASVDLATIDVGLRGSRYACGLADAAAAVVGRPLVVG